MKWQQFQSNKSPRALCPRQGNCISHSARNDYGVRRVVRRNKKSARMLEFDESIPVFLADIAVVVTFPSLLFSSFDSDIDISILFDYYDFRLDSGIFKRLVFTQFDQSTELFGKFAKESKKNSKSIRQVQKHCAVSNKRFFQRY